MRGGLGAEDIAAAVAAALQKQLGTMMQSYCFYYDLWTMLPPLRGMGCDL